MHQELIKEAIEKIKKETEKKQGKLPSNSKAAQYLSETILNDYGIQYGARSIRNVLNEKASINQPNVTEKICQYLGYECYQSFVEKQTSETPQKIVQTEQKQVSYFKKNKQTMTISITALILVIFGIKLFSTNKKQRWMQWKTDHYEEINLNSQNFSTQGLFLLKEDQIKDFKKIEVDCQYPFFDKNKNVKIWYGKNARGKLEFFTSIGLHPETKKSLKPITPYMIKKYICPDYKKPK